MPRRKEVFDFDKWLRVKTAGLTQARFSFLLTEWAHEASTVRDSYGGSWWLMYEHVRSKFQEAAVAG